MRFQSRIALLLAGIAGFSMPASAVILSATADRNTTAPTGALANTGWDHQGLWRGFLGTPISKKYFITVGHIGGGVGENFQVGGRRFVTTSVWDDPGSDLRIYTVNKKFDSWAPLYTGNVEVGKHGVMFGRGSQRGDPVNVNGQLAGWRWGNQDTVKSWGVNQIDQITPGAAGEGDLLQLDFDQFGVANEATLSAGDSGGGIFIYDKKDKRYELAGLSFSVDGPFKLTQNGAEFNASLFNLNGVYYGDQLVNSNQQSRFFAARISTNLNWINGVLNGTISPTSTASSVTTGKGVPEPATLGAALAAGIALLRRRRA